MRALVLLSSERKLNEIASSFLSDEGPSLEDLASILYIYRYHTCIGLSSFDLYFNTAQ